MGAFSLIVVINLLNRLEMSIVEERRGVYTIEKRENTGRIGKIASFCIKHWKKAAIATPIVAFLSNLAYKRYEEDLICKEACMRARIYGDQKVRSTLEKPKKVTLFVNPHANNQKALNQVERSLLHMLHLAGIDVRVVKMESEGEAKELVAASDDSEAIAVAGGDGTVSEIITGMMHSDAKVQRQPLLIVPVGYKHNSLYKSINHSTFLEGETIRNIIASGDSFLSNSVKPVNLMKVVPIPTQSNDASSLKNYKSVYSTVGVSFGPYRDVLDQSTIDKYWYFGPFKKLFVAAKSTFGYNEKKIDLNIKWTDVCPGCKLCKQDKIKAAKNQLTSLQRGFLGNSSRNREAILEANKTLKLEKIENKKCQVVRARTLRNVDHIVFRPFKDGIEIAIATESTPVDFFMTSLYRFRDPTAGFTVPTRGKTVTINCKEVWVEQNLKEGGKSQVSQWFSIDNENFEAVPFYAKFYRDQINVFKS